MVKFVEFREFASDLTALVLGTRVIGVIEPVMGCVEDPKCGSEGTWWLDDTSCLVGSSGKHIGIVIVLSAHLKGNVEKH